MLLAHLMHMTKAALTKEACMSTSFRQTITIGSALAALFLTVGCSTDPAAPIVDEPTSAFDRLRAHPELDLLPASTWVDMTARLNRGDRWIESTITLPVNRGNVWLGANEYGDLSIDGFAISFADVVAGAGVISEEGLTFTDIVVRMGDPVVCQDSQWRHDGDYCEATAKLTLSLDWSLVIDDHIYPLGTQQLGQVAVTLDVYQKAGKLFAELDGAADGVFWQWAGIVEFADVRFQTTAVQPLPIVD